jgi:predicted nucleotidyltransferase component of viral defense system
MQRLIEHEALQMAMLQWLGSKRFLNSLAFGGETMLRLCHEFPRYSLGLDFSFFKQESYNGFYDRLYAAFSEDHDVIDAKNGDRSIVVEVKRKRRMPKLKIEITKTMASPGSTEEKIAFSPHFPLQILVRGFTLQQMLKNKIVSLVSSGEIRDAFDVEFFVRKGVNLNLPEAEKKKVLKKLKGFKKRDFDVKLGGILQPELRDYYGRQRFAYLEEKLLFEQWGNEG